MALKENEVIGCILLVPLNSNKKKGQLTQMAVKSSAQGQGIGKLLVQFLLKIAQNESLDEVVIHARNTVTPFYEQFGFKIFGQEFQEVGLIHRMMSLKLKS